MESSRASPTSRSDAFLGRCRGEATGGGEAEALEHLAAPADTLRRVRDCLKPGGELLVSVPNVANAYVRLSLLFGKFEYSERGILDQTHRWFYTRKSLRRALRVNGFEMLEETVSAVPVQLAWPRLPRILLTALAGAAWLAAQAMPQLFGYQLLAMARRG